MAKCIRWTEDEVRKLQELYKERMPVRQIAERLGRSLRATYVKAHHLKLPYKPDPTIIELTKQQEYWLKKNFPHMRTQILADHLGISLRSCIRIARRLGVEKTPEFMKESQAVTARLAKESHLRNGTYPPKGVVTENLKKGVKYRFKKKNNVQE